MSFSISNKKARNEFYFIFYFNCNSSNFDTCQEKIEKNLNKKIIPLKFTNSGYLGWNWTGYPTENGDLIIVNSYRNTPSDAIDLEENSDIDAIKKEIINQRINEYFEKK